MWRLLLGTMGVKSLVQGLNAAATAGFEPRTVWSEVRRRYRLATAPPHLAERIWHMHMWREIHTCLKSVLFSDNRIECVRFLNSADVFEWYLSGANKVYSPAKDPVLNKESQGYIIVHIRVDIDTIAIEPDNVCLLGTMGLTWRNHRFPGPFSWFLQKTDIGNVKISSANLFWFEMSKESREKSERTTPDSWCPWAQACCRWSAVKLSCLSECRKTAILAVISRVMGLIWRVKAVNDKQCQLLTKNKNLNEELCGDF